jgi:hypothetical protein
MWQKFTSFYVVVEVVLHSSASSEGEVDEYSTVENLVMLSHIVVCWRIATTVSLT